MCCVKTTSWDARCTNRQGRVFSHGRKTPRSARTDTTLIALSRNGKRKLRIWRVQAYSKLGLRSDGPLHGRRCTLFRRPKYGCGNDQTQAINPRILAARVNGGSHDNPDPRPARVGARLVQRRQRKIKTRFHNRTEINSTLERYAFDQGAPAMAISDLNDPNYLPDGVPPCPVTGGAYTMDPGTNTVLGHTSNTSPGDH